METFSALLDLCEVNSPVTGEFPSVRPVTRSCYVFFDLRLNKRLCKQSRRLWFETPSRSLWHHCYAQSQNRCTYRFVSVKYAFLNLSIFKSQVNHGCIEAAPDEITSKYSFGFAWSINDNPRGNLLVQSGNGSAKMSSTQYKVPFIPGKTAFDKSIPLFKTAQFSWYRYILENVQEYSMGVTNILVRYGSKTKRYKYAWDGLLIYSYIHGDVIKWKQFPRHWPFVSEIHRSSVDFHHKCQWRAAWPPLRRRCFRMHFRERKVLCFD